MLAPLDSTDLQSLNGIDLAASCCAVLCGAVLHAGWNALVKSSGDKELDTALVHFLGAVVALPPLLVVGLPPAVALAVHRARRW